MKKHPLATLALSTALLLATLIPGFAEPKAGDSVAAIWKDGKYYVATVTAVKDGKASLLYEDGDKLEVPLQKVHVFADQPQFEVGDKVIAAWKGAQMFPGTISAVQELTCTVKWADGDKPLDVKKSRIVHAK